jgi:tRNA(fMet)-specific endonuclease VapC
MRYLLDTNIVSYFIKRTSITLEERIHDELKLGSLAISVLTRAELRYGQAAMTPEDKRRGLIDKFFLRLPILPWTNDAADHYGRIKNQLRLQGTPIGEMDTQIAAHALAENLVFVTHNTKHFEKVAGLRVEDWVG